ncbi:hypothetical protein [Cytobacillus oceanisediminis]|uniref:Uncharacterized protein n=1 Tax=Cytobacillus oceanisediminis 2691 TaxID=1196031 RepID=A0A160M7M4_9BACI|nr:hypothetical protein [Cytobacillus oceanisediminis]AND38492.1 hypothetical protein A361_04940 [Cytobacillus oceanisediminis 2691]
MELFLQVAAYFIFAAGSFYFFFGGVRKPAGKYALRHKSFIFLISFLILSGYFCSADDEGEACMLEPLFYLQISTFYL